MKPLNPVYAKEELQHILAGDEYQVYYQNDKNILQSLLEHLKEWLIHLLRNLFPDPKVLEKTSEWLSYTIAALVLVVLVFLIFLILSRFVRQGRFTPQPFSSAEELALTPQRQLDNASALAGKGDFSGALRHLFLSLILDLHQKQWIDAKAWKTNWEYYDELNSRNNHMAKSFNTLAVKFEETLYGGKPITKDDYELYLDRVKTLIKEGEKP